MWASLAAAPRSLSVPGPARDRAFVAARWLLWLLLAVVVVAVVASTIRLSHTAFAPDDVIEFGLWALLIALVLGITVSTCARKTR